jgi:hypothetical protein
MSYLEMSSAPLPDCSSMIISFWFRDISKQQKKPRAKVDWPQGFWTEATADTTMVPPNAQYSFGLDKDGNNNDPNFKNCTDYFNSYGLPEGGILFGALFMTAACVWIPNPPPMPLNTMDLTQVGSFISPGSQFGDALTMMSEYGVRVLLAFGDPGIDYNYCSWRVEKPDVIDAVQLVTAGLPAEFLWWNTPPPYTPYNHKIGKDGKFSVRNYRINEPTSRGKVPPCFIGIDDDGHLFINLQTSTMPTYKGMSFECDRVENMWFTAAAGKPPPEGFTDHSFVPYGPYWNGYQFHHVDISDKIMGCAPDSFLIRASGSASGAPMVTDGGWHHVLLSFDISGGVHVEQNSTDDISVDSSCQAWLALDDKNITGGNLQNSPKVHSGVPAGGLPKLSGTQTSAIFDYGPCVPFSRPAELGSNGILPRNAWLQSFGGLPRDGCQWFVSNTPRIGDGGTLTSLLVGPAFGMSVSIDDMAIRYGGKMGDFNWFYWTNREWMLTYGAAGPPLKATFNPMHPDPAGDPSTFDVPTYDCGGYTIPLAGHPIGIPCSSSEVEMQDGSTVSLVDYNTGIEMAELQIWCNKTLDTGNIRMRRLFVDKDGKPVAPKKAEDVLGKPDILLHGSSNWKQGHNTGTSGYSVDADGHKKVNPKGQFDTISDILSFKPEPKIGK